ncbi:MAG TPA: acyl-CoA synthetase [Acidimicrobiales bacterium]|nr:acyl-CoA synthetase [Acidimicrobiales bacterium]
MADPAVTDPAAPPARVPYNLAKVVDVVAERLPDREVIVWRDLRMTYRQLVARANRVANVLHEHGLGVRVERAGLAGHESGQDHLGLYLHNGNQYLESMIGAYKARVAPFNVNYRYVAEELEYLLRNSAARALVYSARFAPVLAEVRANAPDLSLLLQVADESDNDLLPGAIDYETALAAASPEPPPGVEPSPDDLYILYTGGTTGMPKGVLWRQDDIYVGAMGGRVFGTANEYESYEAIADHAAAAEVGLRIMPLPPFMHGAAQWASWMTFTNGGTIIIQDDVEHLDAPGIWRRVEQENVNTVMIVGDSFARPLVEELENGAHDISSIVAISNGGAPLNPALKQRLLDQLPGTLVIDGVGASETGAQMMSVSAPGAVSSGTFNAGPATVVLDEDLTKVLPPGHDGTGWLAEQGRVPLGYLGDPDKTARTFVELDGVRYAVPGDRARLLDNGQIELLGRDSVTINSGGEKIFAEEVEQAIAQHPAVYDVVVVGRPSERWGNEVVALVQVHEGQTVTDDELLTEAAEHIARYKFPKQFIYLPQLVRSPAGKADYRWARAQAVEAPAADQP